MAAQAPEATTELAGSPSNVARWRWGVHLAVLASYGLLAAILGLLQNQSEPAWSETTGGLLVECLLELGIFGIFFGGAWLASRASRNTLLLRWRPGFWVVPLGLLYSAGLRLAVMGIVLGTGMLLVVLNLATWESLQEFAKANRPQIEQVVNLPALTSNAAYFWLMITLGCFVNAGMCEELWRAGVIAGLRVLWPGSFGSRRGQIGGVAIASVMFGLAHLIQGFAAAVLAGLGGFFLGLIMVLHRSIWPAVIAHGFFDATSFALLRWLANRAGTI